MNREKVIKGLERCKEGGSCDGCQYDIQSSKCIFLLHADALALLKAQEAVEPIPFITTTGEESKNYVVCVNCKSINAIMPKATKQKYCHECGKPVKW